MFVHTKGIQNVHKNVVTTTEGKDHLGQMGVDRRI